MALVEGTLSPDVNLASLDGKTYRLAETLGSNKPVVIAFYKATCPVCQLTLPFVERLARAHPERSIWAVSQDDAEETSEFVACYKLTLPVLLDEALQKSVEFELTNVPSIFLIGKEGRIEQTIIGFDKTSLERLHTTLSRDENCTESETLLCSLFTLEDQVPEFRPG